MTVRPSRRADSEYDLKEDQVFGDGREGAVYATS